MEKSQRLDYLDFAKGLGILLVVGSHLITVGEMGFPGSGAIRGVIIQFDMAAFFVISGYTVEMSLNRHKEAGYPRVLKRALKVLVCYCFWSLVYIYLAKYHREALDFREQFISFLTLRGKAPLWFLSSLALAEAGYVGLRKLFHKIRERYFYAFSAGVIVLSAVCAWGLKKISTAGMAYYQKCLLNTAVRFFPSVAFLVAGAMLFYFMRQDHNRVVLLLAGIGLFAVVAVLTLVFRNHVNMHTGEFGNIILFYVNAVIGSLGLLFFSIGICALIRCRVFPEIGRNSLGIMIFHYPPYFLTFACSRRVCDLIGMQFPVLRYIFCLVLSVAMTYLLTKIVKHFKLFL